MLAHMRISSIHCLFAAICTLLISSAHGEEKLLYIDTDATCVSIKCHDTMGKKEYVHSIGVDGAQCKRCHEIITAGEHRFKALSQQ